MHPRYKHSQVWLADPRYITWSEQGSWRTELRESRFTYNWIPWHHQNTVWSCIYIYNDFAKGSPRRSAMCVRITLNTQDWWGLIHCRKKLANLFKRECIQQCTRWAYLKKKVPHRNPSHFMELLPVHICLLYMQKHLGQLQVLWPLFWVTIVQVFTWQCEKFFPLVPFTNYFVSQSEIRATIQNRQQIIQ